MKKNYALLFLAFAVSACNATNKDEVKQIEASQTPSSAVLVPSQESIAIWVDSKILAPEKMSLEKDQTRYRAKSVDLNRDGKLETLVVMQDMYFCGSGGCTAYLFDEQGNTLNRFTLFNDPIYLSDQVSNGWKDMVVRTDSSLHVLKYDGKVYPSNPSLAPVIKRNEEKAKALVTQQEIYQQDGYEISTYFVEELLMPFNQYHFSFKHHGEPNVLFVATVDLATQKVSLERKNIQ